MGVRKVVRDGRGETTDRRGVMDPRPPAGGAVREPTNGSSERLRKLRTKEEETAGERLFVATLRIRIPTTVGLGAFTAAHPEMTIEILNRSDASKDLSVSDYWIGGHPPGRWAREIASLPDVIKVECLTEIGEGCLYRVTYRNPPVIYLYRSLGMPIQFPLHVQGGCITWEVVARRAESEAVLEYVRRTDPGFQVISIRRHPLRSHLPMLTEAQHQLLTHAMAEGYFAVPRGITLTELAGKLHRSKSAVSEAMALIEKKLLESALRSTSLAP